MASRHPAYRATVYVHRSADPTEATVLTPRAGSPHAEAFRVASVQGVAGFQPYLDGTPQGRRSAIDPLEKTTDTGHWTLTLLDRQLADDPLARWLTAFVGDAQGTPQLEGLKVFVEEALDWDDELQTGTWSAWATGRIQTAVFEELLWGRLSVRELSEDLNSEVFRYEPHPSILPGHDAGAPKKGAWLQQLAPLGVRYAYGDFPPLVPMRARVAHTRPEYFLTTPSEFFLEFLTPTREGIKTRALMETFGSAYLTQDGSGPAYGAYRGVATLVVTEGGVEKRYDLSYIAGGGQGKLGLTMVRGTELFGGVARPANNAMVDVVIVPNRRHVKTAVPILVNEVHPVTMFRWLLEGKFSGTKGDGTPRWTIPYDAASFAALEADETLLPRRWPIGEPAPLNEWVEANILRDAQLAYYFDRLGKVVLVSTKRSAATVAAFALTSASLDAETPPTWEQDRAGAVTEVESQYYVEVQVTADAIPDPLAAEPKSLSEYPDLYTTGIDHDATQDPPRVIVGRYDARSVDQTPRRYVVEASGLRYRANADGSSAELLNGIPRDQAIVAYLEALGADVKAPFSTGPVELELALRLEDAQVAQVLPGRWGTLQLDELPSPATNLRGGIRLVFCVSRYEDGPVAVCRFLDAGSSALAVVPTLGALTLETGAGPDANLYTLAAVVTRNAAGDPARLEVASTPAGTAAAPAAGSQLWRFGAQAAANGTVRVPGLLGNMRHWARLRSEGAAGAALKLPSGWVFSTGVDYVDTPALGGIVGLTADAASVTEHSARVFWTTAPAGVELEVYVAPTASAPATWTAAYLVRELPAGSLEVILEGLAGPNVSNRVAVVARDSRTGTRSLPATLDFATTVLVPDAPRPAGLGLAQVQSAQAPLPPPATTPPPPAPRRGNIWSRVPRR